MAESLRREYDYGKILITRALFDITMVRSGIDLKEFIQEANFRYYDEAVNRPWLFARWVIMINRANSGYLGVQLANEKISARWENNPEFLAHYELVSKNDGGMLYRVREEAVRDYARRHELAAEDIPSLSTEEEKMKFDFFRRTIGENAAGLHNEI
jgi:hypothetical protein